jgi:aminopeptidase
LDSRVTEHANLIVTYSTKVKEGDNVLIQMTDCGIDLATEIYRISSSLGASPLIVATPTEATWSYYNIVQDKYLSVVPTHLLELVKASDVVVIIRGDRNPRALSSIDPGRLSIRQKALDAITRERLTKRWCLTQYPTDGYAQEAEMSLKEYEDFVYGAILRNWDEERARMERLAAALNRSKTVRIVGDETDLTLSVSGRMAVVGDITHNVPGGEVFTAPIENSAEGVIYFDIPALAFGREIMDVRLKFHRGMVVEYSAGRNENLLRSMLETDDGARRLGELGIGTNYGITRFTRNILFDEKIGGTIHLALGRAYKECGGINESAIHWDLIKSMRRGKILFDGKVIQSNGEFDWDAL